MLPKESRSPYVGAGRGTTPAAVAWFFGNNFRSVFFFMGETAWFSSDQPHEAAPGWILWFGAAFPRYKGICLFGRFFFTCSKKKKKNTAFR